MSHVKIWENARTGVNGENGPIVPLRVWPTPGTRGRDFEDEIASMATLDKSVALKKKSKRRNFVT